MLRISFCPFCHQFFKEESRIFHVEGGLEPIETHEVLFRKAMEFLGLKETSTEGLESIFKYFAGYATVQIEEAHLSVGESIWHGFLLKGTRN